MVANEPSAADKTGGDDAVTVEQLRQAVDRFVAARRWYDYHSPKNLAMSIAIEAAEIMEHFQWRSSDEAVAYVADPAHHRQVADELADVLIYCLSFANVTGIDVSRAIFTKLARNEVRFPVEETRITKK
jgi:NTP pyrophosphatase (non-canonical NTP hydrolase)